MNFLSRLSLKFPWLVLSIAIVLSFFGVRYSIQLYLNLRTDLEELLPTTARSVLDLEEVSSRLESIDNLSVVVLSDHPKDSKRFVEDLAKKLETYPKDTIASVEFNITQELAFFKDRSALYMDLRDLQNIREYVRDRIRYEHILYNPLTIFSGVETPEPRLDLTTMKLKYESKTSTYSRFPDGYYATPDEKKRVLLVNVPSRSAGGNPKKLKAAVVESIAALKPESYASDLKIIYTGGVQNTIEEQDALVEDLELSTIIVTLIVGFALIFFFRAVRASLALLTALLMGTFWTFGLSYFLVGYLNANSAFLGSIVIGNGINFPIIFLARYLEERRADQDHPHALEISLKQTAVSTWTAALAAGLSYGSLALTGFRGFRQFGIIGLVGMVLCWIASFTVLPSLLTILERRKSLKPKRAAPKAWIAGTLAHFVQTYPKSISVFSLALTVISLVSLTRYSSQIIETDLTKLRNKTSMESGSGYYSIYVDEIFQRYLSPMVILPHSTKDTAAIAALLKKRKAAEGENSLIASVQTIEDFIPKQQSEKIATIKEIEDLLPERFLKQLSMSEQKTARELLHPAARRLLKQGDLPPLVLSKFKEKDGSIGKLVVVEPPLKNVTGDGDRLIEFIRELRNTADSVAPGTAVAGTLPISSDLIESITSDGPKATLFAFIAVVTLVILLFRLPSVFFPVLLALCMGVLWLFGFIFTFWYKINFLNFIALPITFGIGVDYAVNIFTRYREEGDESLLKVIRDTGGAVLLCSFTTTIGYASLLIAQNQAFVSFGVLAVLGEITCLIAAMVSLPAILLWNKKRKTNLSNSPLASDPSSSLP
jgi:uncharacterized protein